MIAYDLKCRAHGHAFEGWFGSSADFTTQQEKGLIACPICGSTEIEKKLSAPNVGAKSNQRTAPPALQKRPAMTQQPVAEQVTSDNGTSVSETMMNSTALPPQMREAMAKIAEVQSKILEKSEWVGRQFAEEVRAQHYGEADARLVHGEASPDEARDLHEEGINIMPVVFPVAPPDKRN